MLTRFRLLTIILLSQASAVYALSFDESRFLLTRTGFTPSFDEVQPWLSESRASAVNKLLANIDNQGLPLPKALTDLPVQPDKSSNPEAFKKYRQQLRSTGPALQRWWYEQMLNTESPFTEQLVLFWHNHFVSSLQKVKNPILMHQQQQLFRQYVLGNFKEMVLAVSQDPAMTIYLDNQSNRKNAPNENYARELMELFTLGEGHYSEEDIKAAARAFTGWRVDAKTWQFTVSNNQHDKGEKTFFGQTGNWTGEDIVDLIFATKGEQVARFMSEKFWRAFVSPDLNEAKINELAEVFIEADFELQPLLQALLMSDEFWAQMHSPNLIKSPVDLVIGTQRLLNSEFNARNMIKQMSVDMEQKLFAPPNVKGWPGGTDWISSTTLIARAQWLDQISEEYFTSAAMMNKRSQNKQLKRFSPEQWQSLVLGALAPSQPLPEIMSNEFSDYQVWLSALLKDPAYQLK